MSVHQSLATGSRTSVTRQLVTPVAALLLFSGLMVAAILVLFARAQDRTAAQSEVHLARSAISATARSLGRTAKDWTWWDEAIEKAVIARDIAWSAKTFGAYAADDFALSHTYLLDAGNRVIFAYPASVAAFAEIDPSKELAGGLGRMIDEARAGPMDEPAPVTGFLGGGGQVFFVAVSPFTPESPTQAQLKRMPRPVLVLAMAVSAAYLGRVRQEFLLAGLQLRRPGEPAGDAAVSLSAYDGTPLGALSWSPDRPGQHLLGTVLPAIGAALLVVGMLVWWFLRGAFRTAVQIQNAAHLLEAQNRALERSEHRTRAIVDNVADGILTVDSAGCIETINAAAERLFGYARADAVGREATTLFDGPEAEAMFGAASGGQLGDDFVRRALTGRRQDASTFPVDLAMGELVIAGERMLTAVVRDTTSQRCMEDALRAAKDAAEEASESKSRFLANVSHELRTPLNAIIGFSELLKSDALGPLCDDERRAYADHIHVSGEHLLSLINDILDVSKAEARKLELQEGEIDVATTIAEAVAMVSQLAAERGIDIHIDTPATLPRLRADGRRVKQILLNLLSNAIKFSREGGEIRVGARRAAAGGIHVTVVDSGAGLSPDEVERALTPFVQLKGVSTDWQPGTGLGLPLTKMLVERHGGKLVFDGEPGKGTTVTVRFPADRTVRS